MTLAQRCDEIIRMIDEVLEAELRAELATLDSHPSLVVLNRPSGAAGPGARR